MARRRGRRGDGDYLVQCDKTGVICYASQCELQWNGLFVLKKAWTPRHPLELPPQPPITDTPPIVRTIKIRDY